LRSDFLHKILIIYSKEGKLKEIAEGIAEGARKEGNETEVIDTTYSERPVTFFPYDLVVAGAPTQGIIRASIPSDLSEFLKKCKRTGGQKAVAFVTPRFFATNKALKKVMGELEKIGCIVNDFRAIKNRKEAVEFGQSLQL